MGSLQQEKMEESRGAQTHAQARVRHQAACCSRVLRAVEDINALDYLIIVIIIIITIIG